MNLEVWLWDEFFWGLSCGIGVGIFMTFIVLTVVSHYRRKHNEKVEHS